MNIDYTPIVTTLITVVLGGMIVGAWAAYNRRRGNSEAKGPSVEQLWREQAADRRLARVFEDLFYRVRSAARSYVQRTQAGGSTELTDAEREAFALEPPPIEKEKP